MALNYEVSAALAILQAAEHSSQDQLRSESTKCSKNSRAVPIQRPTHLSFIEQELKSLNINSSDDFH